MNIANIAKHFFDKVHVDFHQASVVFKRPYDFNLTFRDLNPSVCSMFAFFLCDACLKNVV